MNHVRFMISPELYVVQENLPFDIVDFQCPNISLEITSR